MQNYPHVPPNPYTSPSPPPPPKPPGRATRFLLWYREQPLFMKIGVWIVGAFVVIFVGSAAIAGLVQGIQGPGVSPIPTAGVQATQPPTATPKPRTGPTRAQIDSLLTNSGTEATVVSYDQQSAALVTQIGFGYKVAVNQDGVKGVIGQVQTLVWQKGWYFSSVRVNAFQYQQSGPNIALGYGLLTYKTASTIDWTAPPADLWSVYDQKSISSQVPAS